MFLELNKTRIHILKWTARIISGLILVFGLPFYFGYGNPLPFIRPDYNLWDNTWLTVFPFMFVGLAVGWKNAKIGGLISTIPIAVGLLIGLLFYGEVVFFMLIPLFAGILYLIYNLSKEAHLNESK